MKVIVKLSPAPVYSHFIRLLANKDEQCVLLAPSKMQFVVVYSCTVCIFINIELTTPAAGHDAMTRMKAVKIFIRLFVARLQVEIWSYDGAPRRHLSDRRISRSGVIDPRDGTV